HPSVSAGFLPGVLAALHAEHPQLRVQLTEHTTPDLVSGIAAGRFHIAIHSLASDPPSDDLLSVHLWTEHFVAVVPPGHPLLPAAPTPSTRRPPPRPPPPCPAGPCGPRRSWPWCLRAIRPCPRTARCAIRWPPAASPSRR